MDAPRLALRTAEARVLELADAPALQELLVGCSDYFRGADGRAPDKHAALERLSGALGDARVCLWGFLRGPKLLGILELHLDEPQPEEATIALLLIAPPERRRGLGREVADAVLAALFTSGARAVHLGVQDHQEGAHAFWQALGFIDDGRDEGVTRYLRSKP